MGAVGDNPAPMSKHEINRVRTAVWMRVLEHEAKTHVPDRIEEAIAHNLDEGLIGSRNLAAFSAGRRLPFKNHQSPVPSDAVWPRRAAKVWSVTGDWFFTPFWFLVDDQTPISLKQLGECLRLLPLEHQDYLYSGVPGGDEEPLNFLPIDRGLLFMLTVPATPWSLGALACARRRASIAGEGEVARWCGVAIVWLLLHLGETHVFLAKQMEHLASFMLTQLADVEYPPFGVSWPLEDADLLQFAWEHEQYAKLGIQGALDVLDARGRLGMSG